MASIRKRANNQWQAQVRIKGSPIQSKTFKSQKDALDWSRSIETQILRGIANLPNRKTVEPLKAYLIKYEKEVTPSKKGSVQELSRLKFLQKQAFSATAIDRVRSHEVSAWRDERLKQVSAATVVRELAILSNVFSVARTEWGLEGLVNPVEGIRKPRISNARTRRISPEELNQLLDQSHSPQLKAVVLLAIESAMRRSEICALKWEDVDLENRTIYLSDTKNGNSRSIPLSKHAKTLLEALSESRGGKVFGMRPDSVTQAFNRAVSRANIKDLRFHDTRHEATSRLFEKGLNIMEAASVTGHKDVRMLSRYSHFSASALAQKLG